MTILITGATGMVGSSLVPTLRKKSFNIIYLIRKSLDKSSLERFNDLFGEIGENEQVIDGDVTLPFLGIDGKFINSNKGSIDKIIHCAASVRFDDEFYEEIKLINIEGTKNVIDLAKMLNVTEIHHISTAYIAGDAEVFSESDFDLKQKHRNIYESSKMEAERLVRNSNIPYSIYRLGIVVGSSENGYINGFHGYYGFLKSLWRLRKKLLSDWQENNLDCMKKGFSFDSNDILRVPLSIDYKNKCTINIVPVDWVAKMISKLTILKANNLTFHLTYPNPPTVDWLIRTSLPLLKIDYNCINQKSINPYVQELQKVINKSIDRFYPYIHHEPVFISENCQNILKENYDLPPNINKELIEKLINYALQKKFDKIDI